MRWLVASNAAAAVQTALRAEVRVIWHKDASLFNLANACPLCVFAGDGNSLDLSDPLDGVDDFHAVYATSIIRYTPTGQ